jgi:hypothetical protein
MFPNNVNTVALVLLWRILVINLYHKKYQREIQEMGEYDMQDCISNIWAPCVCLKENLPTHTQALAVEVHLLNYKI